MKLNSNNSYRKRIHTVPAKWESTSAHENSLYTLLLDHPDFQSGVSAIRKHLEIPQGSFKNAEDAFNWEHSAKTNKQLLWDEIDKLLHGFRIKPAYSSSIRFFAYDYALLSRIVVLDGRGPFKVGVRILRTKKDVEFNKYLFLADTTYIEINRQTVLRDLLNAWKQITRRRADVRPLATSKHHEIIRHVWLMTQHGLSAKEIAAAIDSIFHKRLTYDEIPVYRKRYRDKLNHLKKLNK